MMREFIKGCLIGSLIAGALLAALGQTVPSAIWYVGGLLGLSVLHARTPERD